MKGPGCKTGSGDTFLLTMAAMLMMVTQAQLFEWEDDSFSPSPNLCRRFFRRRNCDRLVGQGLCMDASNKLYDYCLYSADSCQEIAEKNPLAVGWEDTTGENGECTILFRNSDTYDVAEGDICQGLYVQSDFRLEGDSRVASASGDARYSCYMC